MDFIVLEETKYFPKLTRGKSQWGECVKVGCKMKKAIAIF